MLVPRERLAEAEQIAAATAEAFAPADPTGERSGIGPLVSDVQRERVRGYIRKGVEEGARLVTGGAEPPEDLPQGFYVRPTVFSDVTPDMTIAQEEIFGPVLVLIPYDDEERGDRDRQRHDLRPRRRRVVRATPTAPSASPAACAPARSRSTAARSTCAPRSAASSSPGNGRENGRFGLEEYLEAKALLR